MNYERGIPPELPENEKKQIFEALIHHRHCQFTDVAMQACDRWEISGELLLGFIQQHFDSKHKIYKKSDGYNQGRYLPWTAQASSAPTEPGSKRILGAVYVSCAGRGGPHFGGPSAEMHIVRRALGDVPLVGFFAGGEIAHRHLHGYTGVLTVFTSP